MLPRKVFKNLDTVMAILELFEQFLWQILFNFFASSSKSFTKYDTFCSHISIYACLRPLSHERHESYDFNFCHVILSATAFHTSDSNRTTLFHNGSGRSGCCVSAGRFTKECYVIR